MLPDLKSWPHWHAHSVPHPRSLWIFVLAMLPDLIHDCLSVVVTVLPDLKSWPHWLTQCASSTTTLSKRPTRCSSLSHFTVESLLATFSGVTNTTCLTQTQAQDANTLKWVAHSLNLPELSTASHLTSPKSSSTAAFATGDTGHVTRRVALHLT